MLSNQELYELTTSNNNWQENSITDTQWKLVTINGQNILVFPPTQSTLDWKQNFDFFIVPYKNMTKKWYAHRGFLLKYKSVNDNILNAVKGLDNLTITGYSQGAALAVLAHEDIHYNYLNLNINSIVFGCPKVVTWNAPSVRWSTFVRYKNGNDIVTHVPPSIFGFKYVGTEIKVGVKRFFLSIRDHANYSGNI